MADAKALRIAVAHDVIASLDIITPVEGVFCIPRFAALTALKGTDLSDVRSVASRLMPGCEVCALGACLLSLVKLDNNFEFDLTIEPVADDDENDDNQAFTTGKMQSRLLDVFEPVQIWLIEAAFEGGRGYYSHHSHLLFDGLYEPRQDLLGKACEFCADYPDEKERLRAIMVNIIQNEGTFVL